MMSSQPVILYVEDEPKSRRVMQMIGSDMGLEHLTVFEDSADFLNRVKALSPKPNVILLDIHVKPHTGFEMLKILRESGEFTGVPIVAITASVMNEEIGQLRTAGFDGCVAKPLDMDTFPDTLNRIQKGEIVWRIIT